MIAGHTYRLGSRLRVWCPALTAAIVASIIVGRAVAATRPMDEVGPLAIATHLYALVLVAGLLLLAAALGRAVLRTVGLAFDGRLEAGLFSVALGLGITAYGVLGAGLVGLLTTPILAGFIAALVVLIRRDLADLIVEIPAMFRTGLALRRSLREQGYAFAFLLPLVEILFVMLLVQALVPPTANDVLTYHLGAPKRFLELGRLTMLPDIQQANMPLTINMLYLLGLALGSDELGSVLHLALTVLVVAATFSFGRFFLSTRIGWMAAIAFVSTRLLILFAAVPNVEYGFALFDFLAVYAFCRWRQSEQSNWLLVSGTLVGFSLGSKYLGGISAVALGTLLVFLAIRSRQQIGLSGIFRLVLTFALPAALIAAPWYVKNLLFFGNPIWPMIGADPNDFNMYHGLNARFSGGMLSWLLVPFRLYMEGSVEYPGVHPSLALLVIPLYAVLPKNRVVTGLLALSLFHFLIWVQASHVLRYLVQVMPELCLVAAYVLAMLPSLARLRAVGRIFASGVLIVGLVIPTTFTVAIVLVDQPFAQLVGLESRQSYLDRHLHNNRLVTRLNQGGDDVRGVLMVGDDRAFYLNTPKWIDVSLIEFQQIAMAPDPEAARAHLAGLGASHVMVNVQDLNWYKKWDPENRLTRWMDRFDETWPGYLVVEATSGYSTLYRVVNDPMTTVQPPVERSAPR